MVSGDVALLLRAMLLERLGGMRPGVVEGEICRR